MPLGAGSPAPLGMRVGPQTARLGGYQGQEQPLMAISRTYVVSFSPAERHAMGYTVAIDLSDTMREFPETPRFGLHRHLDGSTGPCLISSDDWNDILKTLPVPDAQGDMTTRKALSEAISTLVWASTQSNPPWRKAQIQAAARMLSMIQQQKGVAHLDNSETDTLPELIDIIVLG